MIRIMILLLPAYVSLFWTITLISKPYTRNAPKKFLSVFMLFPLVIFSCHFSYFAPLPEVYPYLEPVLAYFGSMAFPMYYIYFRLLTVDEKFSLKKHSKYLILPYLVATVYTIGILISPWEEYKTWLFNEHAFADSPYIQFLSFMRVVVRLTFVVLLVITYLLNRGLLRKYAHKAEQYYSDIQDGKYNNAKKLNYYLLIVSISSFLAVIVGRELIMSKEVIISFIWMIFAFSIYEIGYMGFTQKPVNPTFELVSEENAEPIQDSDELKLSQQVILQKLLDEFEQERIFMNSKLNITDIVHKIGTNRTYISAIINQHYNLNFCSFVNQYRIAELERIFVANPMFGNELLAEKSGFGSLNSMKRAVSLHTGYSIAEWKRTLLPTNVSEV